MFCGHCGQYNPDSNTQCASCGKEIKLSLNTRPAAAAAPAAAPAPQAVPSLSYPQISSGPQGVGGWLLFFCVITTIINPIALLALASNYGSETSDVLFNLTLAVFSLWTGIELWRVSKHALEMLQAYLIAHAAIAFWMFFRSDPFGAASADLQREAAGQLAKSLIRIAVWWSYFHVSKRVRATYGRNL